MEMKAHAYSPSSCGKSDEKPLMEWIRLFLSAELELAMNQRSTQHLDTKEIPDLPASLLQGISQLCQVLELSSC